ncbi:hypothetical protein ACG04R_23145 [Roseateles sp. BYS78W]|uniref:Uncharacterized protein n=1 Tax=Pelomonas candidula TaxID=3299025 RepID=A0ABW7HJD3_9BURK
MSIWELKAASPDQFAPLVPTDAQVNSGIFEFDGTPRVWRRRPTVAVFQERSKKHHLPRGDASLLLSGALVLNQKAADALGPFLAQFGQLLEARVDGAIEYFYNVTRLIDCIDPERSERRASGAIAKPAFRPHAVPHGPTVFKDLGRREPASMPTMKHGNCSRSASRRPSLVAFSWSRLERLALIEKRSACDADSERSCGQP